MQGLGVGVHGMGMGLGGGIGGAGGMGGMEYPDITERYDHSARIDGTAIEDASTEQLTAFLDEVSDTASLQDASFDLPAAAGVKRKSDVAELPPPVVSTDSSLPVPKAKRKR